MVRGYRVLLIDAGLSTTSAVMRALRRDGATVFLAVPAGATGAARLSHRCAGHLVLPSHDAAGADVDAVVDFARRHAIDVILPLADETVQLLDRHREFLERHVALAIPPSPAAADCLDKGRTLAVARRVADGFEVPATLEPDGPEEVDPEAVLRWPVLIKPRRAAGARGIHAVADTAALRATYAAVHRDYPRPLIQEQVPYRPGMKYQLYYLFDGAGELCARFMHRILHEARGITGPGGVRLRGLSGSIQLCLRRGPNLAAGACRMALGQTPPHQLDFPRGLRARRDAFHMMQAGEWLRLLDPRFRAPNSVFADPVPFAAALAGRFGTGARAVLCPGAGCPRGKAP